MVHPDFRRQGIGTMLLEKCLELAENSGYCIQYLMTSIENKIAHRLYAKYGFIPTIIPRKRSSGRDMWLHRFSKNTFVKEFLLKHPFAEKVLSKNRVYFEERKLYRVTLRDIISDNYLLLCFEGQPGQTPEGTMPRITGVCIKYSKVHLSIVVEEEQKYLTKGEACFRLKIINKGLKKINFINIGFMSAPGIKVYLPKIEEIKEHSKKEIEVKCIFSKEFDVPLLSFNTAVVTICMNLDKVFQNPLLVSAGFEINR